jgi:hypothetical protein
VWVANFSRPEGDRRPLAYSLVRDNGLPFLTRYMNYLADQAVAKLDRDAQLAYWLNVRNLLVVQAIAELESGADLAQHRGTAAVPGPAWTRPRFVIGEVALSIDDIERKILLPGWPDPRIIPGLYQGSESGPAFPAEAFRAATAYQQLATAGVTFVNSAAGVRVSWGKARVSPLFGWYREALFNGQDDEVKAHLMTLMNEALANKFAKARRYEVEAFSSQVESFQPRRLHRAASDRGLEPGPQPATASPDDFVGRGS